MKPILYAVVFALLVALLGFGYFAISTPDIPQQVVTKQLDARAAFAPAS